MKPNAIRLVRDCMPLRPLYYAEALRYAELQAERFLALQGIDHPAVPESAITTLPRVHVNRFTPFPLSGAAHWTEGRWMIALNGAEPLTRQRFSLAHEFKHVLDHRFIDVIYAEFPEAERDAMVERICDHFAACLLMPRTWVHAAYFGGTHGVIDLARMFGVSSSAMSIRLRHLGIKQAQPRCGPSHHNWRPAVPIRKQVPHRASHLVT